MNSKKAEILAAREKTLSTLRAIDENICVMEYFSDYDLPRMLAAGKSTFLSMARIVQKILHAPGLLPNPWAHGGCSAFNTLTPEGQPIVGRNFDFKNAKCLAVWTHPKVGYRSLAMVNQNLMLYADLRRSRHPLRAMGAPYASMDGVNEKGLCITILELIVKPVQQHTGKTPISTNVAVRGILDTCATTEEAIQFLERYDMQHVIGACYHFHFTDVAGNSAVVEYVDGKMYVYRKGAGEGFKLSNFFLTPSGHCREKGRDRVERMECALREKPAMTEDQVMDVMKDCRVWFRSIYKVFMIGTLWSAVYNCSERTMLLCAGRDYSRRYKLSLDKPLEVVRVDGESDSRVADKPAEN